MENQIVNFLHCGLCLDELPEGVSPREFVQLEAGWTVKGIQLWCMASQNSKRFKAYYFGFIYRF